MSVKKMLNFDVVLKSLLLSNLFVCASLNRTERLMYKSAGFQKRHDKEYFNEVTLNPRKFDTRKSDDYRNYLNYRDVYGLRYSPVVLNKKVTINNNNEVDEKSVDDVKTEEEHLLGSSVESETISNYFSSETIAAYTESSATAAVQNINFTLSNFVQDEVEDDKSEMIEGAHSTHHIMKPNNRVEHALNFLANRMKNLLYYGNDPARPESQIVSPHLLSLGKFLNVFSSLRFDNGPCIAGHRPMRQLSGSCVNEVECINFGGISMNRCGNGLGVCCIFKASCGSVVHHNVTYFESPNFPFASQANLGSCTLTLLLMRDVRQVLLEFQFFELMPPKQGNCIDDQFTISNELGSMNHEIPILCGTASNQHIYLEVNGYEKLFLSVLTHSAEDRAFSIKVTQLRMNDNLAPAGCMQYFRGSEGIIKSFNYDDEYSKFTYRNPSYFNNMNYAICIERARGFCQIYYTNEIKGGEEIFEMINKDAGGNILAEGQAGAEIFSCPNDFIAVNYIRLCGSKLNDGSLSVNFKQNTPVRDIMNGPIIIPVKTDNATTGRGFKLFYFQEKCEL